MVVVVVVVFGPCLSGDVWLGPSEWILMMSADRFSKMGLAGQLRTPFRNWAPRTAGSRQKSKILTITTDGVSEGVG